MNIEKLLEEYDKEKIFSEEEKFVKIYDGYHSKVYKYKDYIVKRINKGDLSVKNEIYVSSLLNNIGINTHYIIDYSVNGKWIVYDYIDFKEIPDALSLDLYKEIINYMECFENIEIDVSWDNYKNDCLNALSYFENMNGESEYKKLLIDSVGEIFIHGDLNKNNIFYSGDKLYIIDFENACYGPKWWDKNYLLSEYYIDNIDEKIFKNITKEDCQCILLIKQIRIGRLIRKKMDYNSKYEDYKKLKQIYETKGGKEND